MFSSKAFLPDGLIARLTETRVNDPEFAMRAAGARVRREGLTTTGKLNLLAADHPARNVTKVGAEPLAMADRHDYLARILRVLQCPLVDGVMATMDLLEDLLSIDGFLRAAGKPTLLDRRVLIASLNRGGLDKSSWELDDPITGPRPAVCRDWSLDGTKLLLRIDESEPASLKTLRECARAIDEANALFLPTFLEPLPVKKTENGYAVIKAPEALAKLVGVASALGNSSRYLWLKLPYCESYEIVARATTLPILILGGESAGNLAGFLKQLESAVAAAPNVRGALLGRNVLYPGDADPLAMAAAVGKIIHEGCRVDDALGAFSESHDTTYNPVAGLDLQ